MFFLFILIIKSDFYVLWPSRDEGQITFYEEFMEKSW